jgi:glycosyltransferase involved in cell wall biosynthesis
MRVLFVSLTVPFPPIKGHRIRNWMLLRALAAEGHEVSLLGFAEPHEVGVNPAPLKAICRAIELVPLPGSSTAPVRSALARLRTVASPLPYGVHRFESEPMKRAIRDMLDRTRFDFVLCDDIYQVKNLAGIGGGPVLLNKHDITHVILRRYLAYERNLAKRAYGWLEYAKVRRWEAKSCSAVSGMLACSEEDLRVMRPLMSTSVPVAIAPNVIDTEEYRPRPEVAVDPNTVLYVGAMDWYPNLDAVRFFVRDILPELRCRVPGVRFRIAGRSPDERLRRQLESVAGVEFTGTVPDMREEIARATVCVVPLRIGSGTRLKILEAGAMEKAMVSTRVGSEGLELVNGEEILLADDPRTFARLTADLLGDEYRRRLLGSSARARIAKHYSLVALREVICGSLPLLVRQRLVAPLSPPVRV